MLGRLFVVCHLSKHFSALHSVIACAGDICLLFKLLLELRNLLKYTESRSSLACNQNIKKRNLHSDKGFPLNEWLNAMCIYLPHISHHVSRRFIPCEQSVSPTFGVGETDCSQGKRFTILLSEIGHQLVKAPLAAAISPYMISLTHPTHAWNVRWN